MASGLVTVNGCTVTEPGTKADPSRDHIKVAGRLIRGAPELLYIAVNKPPEVVATMSDPEGRRSLQDLLHGVPGRVFPMGRMEYHSSGLILLTNDGELANRILQSHKLLHTWRLKLKSLLTFAEIELLARSTGARITRLKGKDAPWYEISIHETRRDPLRDRLCNAGHPVEKMKRVAIANVELGNLPAGGHRSLTAAELTGLQRALRGEKMAAAARGAKRRSRDRQHSAKKSVK